MLRQEAYVLEKERFLPWVDSLRKDYRIVGPVDVRGVFTFDEIRSLDELRLDYGMTLMGPQIWLYRPTEKMCTISRADGDFRIEAPDFGVPQILLGVRSCDLHAIWILDKVFMKRQVKDRPYSTWRAKTVVIGYHCTRIGPQCFCASMDTGPHFERETGYSIYDLLVTELGDRLLVETMGDRGPELLEPLEPVRAGPEEFKEKERIRRRLLTMFRKHLDTTDLPSIILRNQEHPVWKQTADRRCLGCTNCTQVCPTCFCYNVKDRISFDGLSCDRTRYKDSCQELHFAEVHGGNFRQTRTARLRQFVTHKLATWWEQLGFWGCIGCGRCMTWCPTNIDLTEMAKVIQRTRVPAAAPVGGRTSPGLSAG